LTSANSLATKRPVPIVRSRPTIRAIESGVMRSVRRGGRRRVSQTEGRPWSRQSTGERV
jgi:hypothetical protein